MRKITVKGRTLLMPRPIVRGSVRSVLAKAVDNYINERIVGDAYAFYYADTYRKSSIASDFNAWLASRLQLDTHMSSATRAVYSSYVNNISYNQMEQLASRSSWLNLRKTIMSAWRGYGEGKSPRVSGKSLEERLELVKTTVFGSNCRLQLSPTILRYIKSRIINTTIADPKMNIVQAANAATQSVAARTSAPTATSNTHDEIAQISDMFQQMSRLIVERFNAIERILMPTGKVPAPATPPAGIRKECCQQSAEATVQPISVTPAADPFPVAVERLSRMMSNAVTEARAEAAVATLPPPVADEFTNGIVPVMTEPNHFNNGGN